MWKDVLPCLRDELSRLDWISLRRIGYEKQVVSVYERL